MQVGTINFEPIAISTREWMTSGAKFTMPRLPEYGDMPTSFAGQKPYDSLYLDSYSKTIHINWPSYGQRPHEGAGNLVVAARKYLHYSGM
jgi:hypothetical protein